MKSERTGGAEDPYRPIRPRTSRPIAAVLAGAIPVGAAALIVVMARAGLLLAGYVAAILVVAAAATAFLVRAYRVAAVPDAEGLVVRNLWTTRRLAWTQIVGVTFGLDLPWAQLDLDDGSVCAVMAIQSSDGVHAADDAARLAALVEAGA